MTKEELIAFEADIAAEFNAGHIAAPIHLSGGNEEALIEIFKEYREGDYCFSTWRSHSHALLAGVPAVEVKAAIMAGRSITLCFPKYRFLSSAIVAGCCPIALGVAWQIKRMGGPETVYCFIGDMALMNGLAMECLNYATWNDLPLKIVVEDNQKSVCSDTIATWGATPKVIKALRYIYELPWPHSGAGQRVNF